MRHTWPPFVLIALIAGCQGDPATGRLAAGTEAIVSPPRAPAGEWIPDVVPAAPGISDDREDLITLGLGTRVTVVDDVGRPVRGEEEGMRPVRANVRDGPHAGQVVRIRRMLLRPAPAR